MSNYKTPGVYLREEDKSLYTRGQSTSVAGFIGVASSGPIADPTLLTSLAAFEETFGGARTDSYLYHGVKDFFENDGGVAYVVRTAHYTDVASPASLTAVSATAVVPVSADVGADPAIEFTLPPGAFYNGYKVVISANADNSININLLDKDNNVIEQHRNVLVGTDSVGSDRYIEAYFPRSSFRMLNAEDMNATPLAGTYTFAGGNDGLTGLDDVDFIGSESAKTGLHAFNKVPSIRLLAAPGLSSPAFLQALIAYCEQRQNIIPILGTPSGLSPQDVIDFRSGEGAYNHSAFNSNYAAMYWPWIMRLDPATRQIRPTPPEGAMAGIYARTDNVAYPWVAPAGKNRGIVRNALGLEYVASKGEIGEVYGDNQVNVIRDFPESGIVVWGQKTLTDKPSAFDRVNVRRLFIYLEQALLEVSDYLTFEPNTEETWSTFVRIARPLLQDVQGKDGIYSERGEPGFKIICDETTNTPLYRERNTLRALIYIRPVKAAEFVELVFVATGQDTAGGFENLNEF
jgi:phage tail sheath protein FI